MSNDLSQVPDYLKQYMDANATAGLDSAATSSSSVPRISTRGRQFRFVENGEEVFKTAGPVNVVILGVEPEGRGYIKTFYVKPYAGADSSDPPDCSSMDGILPAPWINNPQFANCAECPKNAFGSAKGLSGKPSKACKDSKRIWVKRADKLDGPIYGMNVTVSGLPSFAEYARRLKANNVPFHLAVTQLTMEDAEYPQVGFDIVDYAKQEDVAALVDEANKKTWVMPSTPRQAALPSPAAAAALPGVPDYIKNAAPVQGAAVNTAQGAVGTTIEGEASAVPQGATDVDINAQLSKW